MSKQICFTVGAGVPPALSAKREKSIKRRISFKKRLKSALLTFIFSFVIFAPLALTSSSTAQRPVASTNSARNAAVIAATNEVLKETSELRQLSILRPVQSSTQSRAEIENTILKNFDEEMTPSQAHASEITLRKLGLAPADFQYRALLVRVLTEQVAGYYDPKTREFHLADWIDLDGQKPIMAHELTHALQDQHFNLRRFEHWPKGDSDAELAAHALIEGDATLTMAFYVAKNPLRALAFLKSIGTTGMASEELDKAPRALRETLLFPYSEGTDWTRNLYQRGGWDHVSKAFAELPQSTEQILHPEKYFIHEAPVKVTLPDIAPLLNGRGQSSEVSGQRWAKSADAISTRNAQRELVDRGERRREKLLTAHRSLLTDEWRRLDYDVNGEWGFYLVLDQFLKSPAESGRAAAGWGGDRFEVYEGPKGEVLIVSLSVWDTENDAREFFDAYVKRTMLRYPDATSIDARSNTQFPISSKAFRASEGAIVIELRGPRVLVLEGIPERFDSKTLLKSLWLGMR